MHLISGFGATLRIEYSFLLFPPDLCIRLATVVRRVHAVHQPALVMHNHGAAMSFRPDS